MKIQLGKFVNISLCHMPRRRPCNLSTHKIKWSLIQIRLIRAIRNSPEPNEPSENINFAPAF
jgi:hypothetical protein